MTYTLHEFITEYYPVDCIQSELLCKICLNNVKEVSSKLTYSDLVYNFMAYCPIFMQTYKLQYNEPSCKFTA